MLDYYPVLHKDSVRIKKLVGSRDTQTSSERSARFGQRIDYQAMKKKLVQRDGFHYTSSSWMSTSQGKVWWIDIQFHVAQQQQVRETITLLNGICIAGVSKNSELVSEVGLLEFSGRRAY